MVIMGLLLAVLAVSCAGGSGIPVTTQEAKPASTLVTIKVEPVSALIDEVVSIQLSGLAPGQNVTVRARTRFHTSHVWESYATFMADKNGSVDVSAQQPLTGTYETADPMGLFWSMIPPRGEDATSFGDGLDPVVIDLIVEVDGKTAVSAQLERLFVAPEVTRVPVRENGLVGTLFLPGDSGPYPAVIVLGGSDGGLHEEGAALLASHGYAALALAYFHAETLPSALINIPLEYFETAINWLQSHDRVDGKRLGIMGTSRGGELALLVAATFPGIRAVVGYVPSGVVWGGMSRYGRAAWTYQGTPVPYVPIIPTAEFMQDQMKRSRKAPMAYTPLFLANLENMAAVEKAIIAVENINGPVLLISGQDDQIWPSTLMSEMVIDRLAQHNHPYPYEHLSYEGVGHFIGAPYFPTTLTQGKHPLTRELMAFGGNAKDNAFAQADSWTRVLDFLKESLTSVDF